MVLINHHFDYNPMHPLGWAYLKSQYLSAAQLRYMLKWFILSTAVGFRVCFPFPGKLLWIFIILGLGGKLFYEIMALGRFI